MAVIVGTPFNDVLNGTIFNDQIYGLEGNDILNGNAGADTMDGGDGSDTYYVDNVGDKTGEVWNDKPGGVDTVFASASHTIGYGIEHLTLTGSAHINGTGNANNNTMKGNSGNNTIDGKAGADTMDGGDGSDTYYVDNVGDKTGEVWNDKLGGVDTVFASASHTIGYGIEHLTLTGSAHINGTGNANNNTMKGNSGNNTIDGKAGADTMDGGDGSDTYYVDNVGDKTGEVWNDKLGGVDTVFASASHTIGYGIEHLTLTGSAHINGTGNANANVITGNGANNVLTGGDNGDTLNGGNGNDLLDGGNGHDKLNGGAGNDQLIGGAGNDLLYGGAGADALTGGFAADIFDYNAVSESPAGAGRDVIINFIGSGAVKNDQIDLTTIDANTLVAGNQAFTYIGSAAFTAAGQLRYAGGVLSGSTDADAAAEFQIQLVGAPALVVGGAGTDILL